jgi:arginine exporter protein ArgO
MPAVEAALSLVPVHLLEIADQPAACDVEDIVMIVAGTVGVGIALSRCRLTTSLLSTFTRMWPVSYSLSMFPTGTS